MPHWGNATLLEIAWTWLALFGLGLAVRLSFFIRRSRARMHALGIDGIRVQVNRTRQRGQNGRIVVFAALFLVGVLAMIAPPPVRQVNWITSILSSAILVGALLRMVYDSVKDSIDREAVMGDIVDRALTDHWKQR